MRGARCWGSTGAALAAAALLPVHGFMRARADGSADTHALPATVRIVFQTSPAERAEVRWGGRRLGIINAGGGPLLVERPRDSGPLDVVVRAAGYLPVRTRAYTFTDSRVTVKLTRIEDKHALLGYRAPLPDGAASAPAPDAGAPR